MSAAFNATKTRVGNRGVPPDAFLAELLAWGQHAPEEIFAPNNDAQDVFIRLAPVLGPWKSELHRKAALLECMRVLAGFESSWNWNEGVDRTNSTSMHNVIGQETGIFQVSFDSLNLDNERGELHQCVVRFCGSLDVRKFIDTMKVEHFFALEYGARLLRNNFYWDGPIKRHAIDRFLSTSAVSEWMALLTT